MPKKLSLFEDALKKHFNIWLCSFTIHQNSCFNVYKCFTQKCDFSLKTFINQRKENCFTPCMSKKRSSRMKEHQKLNIFKLSSKKYFSVILSKKKVMLLVRKKYCEYSAQTPLYCWLNNCMNTKKLIFLNFMWSLHRFFLSIKRQTLGNSKKSFWES